MLIFSYEHIPRMRWLSPYLSTIPHLHITIPHLLKKRKKRRKSRKYQKSAVKSTSALRLSPICPQFRYLLPINQVPPRFRVIAATILIKQIITVLPQVQDKNWPVAICERAILIRSLAYLQRTVLGNYKPSPSGTKNIQRDICKFFSETVKASECLNNGVGQFTFRPLTVRRHNPPKQRMVSMASAVIYDILANVLRTFADIPQKLFNIFCLQIREEFQCRVEFINVGLMVFAVVNFHCPRVNVRLKRVVSVRQFRKRMHISYNN